MEFPRIPMWPIVLLALVVAGVFFGAGYAVGFRNSSDKVYQLEQQVEVQKKRVEELSGYQDAVSILTEDLKYCRDDKAEMLDDNARINQSLYDCQTSLIYCRKVCGERSDLP